MEKAIIAAVADNMAIGKGNAMPWHISEDMKFFKRTTYGCPVIMGSATFRSLGSRPLPGRLNIVLSGNPALELPAGVLKAGSLEDAYRLASRMGGEIVPQRCFVIGGGRVYNEAVDGADVMYITHVHADIADADVFFPKIDPSRWRKVSVSEKRTDPETGYVFEFVEYRNVE